MCQNCDGLSGRALVGIGALVGTASIFSQIPKSLKGRSPNGNSTQKLCHLRWHVCRAWASHRLGTVHGKVTLDGMPLADAVVRFQPLGTGDSVNVGPPSAGRTDAEGVYHLKVVAGRGDGAVIGNHRVKISTYREEDDEMGNTQVIARESVPNRYHRQTICRGGNRRRDYRTAETFLLDISEDAAAESAL